MRDGRGKWWDVESTPDDLISFPEIKDWNSVSAAHRPERDKLQSILPRFSQQRHGLNAPNVPRSSSTENHGGERRATINSQVIFSDDFEGRNILGDGYTTARGMEHAWTIRDGILIGKQTNDDHGAVMRKQLAFDDLDVEFAFRFSGGTSFNFVIDDENEKSVHAGHVCRVSVSPRRISVSDDKTGSMNFPTKGRFMLAELRGRIRLQAAFGILGRGILYRFSKNSSQKLWRGL